MSSTPGQKQTESLIETAPAKLNLRLKVTGHRSDGYHTLSMLNATLALADDVFITRIPQKEFVVKVVGELDALQLEELEDPGINSAVRAARRVYEELGAEGGVSIRINKRIPIGAGLGGGTSDAAAVLRGLNLLLSNDPKFASFPNLRERIFQLAPELGADVPYSLVGGFAYVSGVGEFVTPLKLLELNGRDCLLIFSRLCISTKVIFDLMRARSSAQTQCVDQSTSSWIEKGAPFSELPGLIENSLAEIVWEHSKELGELFESLSKISGLQVGLTGSGSALFCLSPSLGSIDANLESMVYKEARGFGSSVVRTRFKL